MKILVVEDEKDLNYLITKILKQEKYNVDSCYDGETAVLFLETHEYDLVILDIMLPKKNGYEILSKIKTGEYNTKVLFLSAKDSIEDKILGLDLGADDYLVKPFDMKEFLARVRVQIRQRYSKSSNTLTIDNLILNTVKKIVTRDGIEIDLTAKEYEVLVYLMQNENHVVSREQILENVWQFETEVYSNIIDVMIKNIRKKISLNNTCKQLIFTKRGLGYVMQNKKD